MGTSAPRSTGSPDALSDGTGPATVSAIATDRQLPDHAPPGQSAGQVDDERRRRFGHDIQHELGTIMLLASVLSSSHDVGPESKQRARQILGEISWLDELLRAYDGGVAAGDGAADGRDPVRVDTLASDVVAVTRLVAQARIVLSTDVAFAQVDRLRLWRVMRNLMDNALAAVGSDGAVAVDVRTDGGWVTVAVDDTGPGFGAGVSRPEAQGLDIVRESVAGWGGQLTISDSKSGGGLVTIQMPAAERPGLGLMRGGA